MNFMAATNLHVLRPNGETTRLYNAVFVWPMAVGAFWYGAPSVEAQLLKGDVFTKDGIIFIRFQMVLMLLLLMMLLMMMLLLLLLLMLFS